MRKNLNKDLYIHTSQNNCNSHLILYDNVADQQAVLREFMKFEYKKITKKEYMNNMKKEETVTITDDFGNAIGQLKSYYL